MGSTRVSFTMCVSQDEFLQNPLGVVGQSYRHERESTSVEAGGNLRWDMTLK